MRWPVVPPLERLRERVRPCLPRAWAIEGMERHSDLPLVVCFAGSEAGRRYIADLAFGDACSIKPVGRTWLWRAKSLGRSLGAGLTVVETTATGLQQLGSAGDWLIPAWVDGDITHARMHAAMHRSRSVKDDLNRIRRHGLGLRVTTSVPMLEHFYARMYRPYIAQTHGARAMYMSRELMLDKADEVELLLIEHDGEAVAGALLQYRPGGVRLWALGVLDGDRRHVNTGAIAALYYHHMNHVASRGHDKCDAGASRAFLRDGVLQYKRKWGMAVSGPRSGGFSVSCRADSAGACAFLVHNPFIHRRGDGLYAAGFVDDDAPLDKAVERFVRLHEGLELDGWALLPVRSLAGADTRSRQRKVPIACSALRRRTGWVDSAMSAK